MGWPRTLTFVVGLVAVAGIAATGWVYTETQRDLRRISSDIAQIKLSLELFGRRETGGSGDAAALQELENRLAIVENAWRGNAEPETASLPPLEPQAAPPAENTEIAGPLTDCIPEGTRFLVSAGDSYAVCGTPAVVDVLSVGAIDVTFADGEAIAIGGSKALGETTCTVAVLTANADGLAGYGELRVSC